MIETKLKALMYGSIFVDLNLLHKGIYEAPKPYICGRFTTIEYLSNQHKDALKIVGLPPNDYIKNLESCKLVNITIKVEEE